MPSASRIIRIILISILVIFDVAAVGFFVFKPLAFIFVVGALFCDTAGATLGQCVGRAMSALLPEFILIVLFVYAPLITVFVLVNLITIRFLIDT